MKQIENPNIDQNKLRMPDHVESILQCGHMTVHQVLGKTSKEINASADEINKATDWVNQNGEILVENENERIANENERKEDFDEFMNESKETFEETLENVMLLTPEETDTAKHLIKLVDKNIVGVREAADASAASSALSSQKAEEAQIAAQNSETQATASANSASAAQEQAQAAQEQAQAAQEQAQAAATSLANLEAAILELPDGQAVTEKVAEHTVELATLGQNNSELESRTDGISKEEIETEKDSISIEDNNGNEVFHLDENGLDAKNVKSNGKEVLTEHQDISGLATKDDVKKKQDAIPQISQDSASSIDDEQMFASDDYNEEEGTGEIYGKIDKNGFHAKGFFNMAGKKIGEFMPFVVVDTSGHGDYTSVTEALANVNDSPTKHVTIFVLAGEYYMQPKVAGNKPYVEDYRNITIIGENRNKCVLYNNIGFYDYTIQTDCAPLRLGGNVTLKNLTIRSTSEKFDDFNNKVAGFFGRDDSRKESYSVHRDAYDAEGSEFVIDNCMLINDHMACVGFGLKPNTLLKISNSYVQSQGNTHSRFDDGGAYVGYASIWGHFFSGEKGLGQNLEVSNCQIVNRTSRKAILIAPGPKAADATPADTFGTFTFIGNSIHTTDTQNSLYIQEGSDSFWKISELSHGNQCNSMNK